MSPDQAAVCLSAGGVGVVGSWVWAFLTSPRRRTAVPEPQPAPSPPEPPQGLVRGFAWSVVALTDMFLDEEPSEQRERAYVDALAHGTHVYEEMTQR